MQSHFDHLIHKHVGQLRRRAIPGAFLAAAAIVAVVLFLATRTNVQAHDPGPADHDSHGVVDCDRLASGALSVSSLAGDSRSLSSSDGNCQLLVEATPPVEQGVVPTDCLVNYTPATTVDGLEVTYDFIGECDGVEINSEVTFPNDDASGNPLASSASSKWALSKLFTHDVIHVVMFLHYSRVDWTYNGSEILSTKHRTYSFTNDWWHVHSTNKVSYMNSMDTIFDGWHSGVWHSDGFPTSEAPDVHSKSKVTVRVRATGSHTCYYTFKWVSGAGNYPDLHKHTLCQHGGGNGQ